MSKPSTAPLDNSHMHIRRPVIVAVVSCFICFPGSGPAEEQTIIPLKSEPHHHLVLHNEMVNVYWVQVLPHDSVKLHRHDADAIGIMLSDAEITVRSPGKPDSHQNVTKGQLRLQVAGYVHSTTVDGENAYRNVTVEVLRQQDSPRNLCAQVMPAKPLDCPKSAAPRQEETPEFETNQTRVTLIRIPSSQGVALGTPGHPQLLVMLDNVTATDGAGNHRKTLRAGEFLWREHGSLAETLTNDNSKEARVVIFAFKKEPL